MGLIKLDLPPELEQKLWAEAAKQGLEPARYVMDTLQERLQSADHSGLSEAELLKQINIGFSEETWTHYRSLITKRRAEALTPEEHQQLSRLSDHLERLNVTRVQALIQLAQLRGQLLEDLMQSLGIRPEPEALDYA